MKLSISDALRLAVALVPLAAAPAALAQSTIKAAPASTDPAPAATLATPDSKTTSAYKQATWRTHEKALKAGTSSREIPPTDCPPLPAQDCLDTWDDEMTTKASPE